MSKHKQRGDREPTPPSEAVGESGDREARQAADDAVIGRAGDTGRGDPAGHSAKRQQPGIGREEQVRRQPEGDDRPKEGGGR
ncbi:hypothetical protein [Streptomyces sp. NPDC054849]